MQDYAVTLQNVSKVYRLYNDKKARMKEAFSISGKKYHREFKALQDINLNIPKGNIVGILGRNGAGKSTLLKVISSILTPTTGTVNVRGKMVALYGFGGGFNENYTGRQNIYFSGAVVGFSRAQMREKEESIIEFADIGDFIDQPVKTYSSGMRARLAFAVATDIDPDILVLDEVLGVGDVLFRRKCFARMEKFFKGGKTILFVNHSTGSVNELCNSAILLDRGEVILEGDTKTVTTYYEKMLFAGNQKEQQEVRDEIVSFNKHAGLNIAKSQAAEAKIFQENCSSNKNILNPDKGLSVTEKKSQAKNDKLESVEKKKKERLKENPTTNNFVEKDEPYFVKNFKSKSKVEFRSYDADIYDFSLTTLNGEPVNHLVLKDEYIYSFKVGFNITAKKLAFGSAVKTEKGLVISGANLRKQNIFIDSVKPGDVYAIDYRFTCNLLGGVYYFQSGVNGVISKERVVLNRVVDALVFRVLFSRNTFSTGLVTLNQSISYKKI